MQTEIRNSQGEKIDYTFHSGGDQASATMLIGHGVTGNKDRAHLVALAEGLAASGINALRFSFAGNGDSEGEFTACTISKEVGDLGAVIDAAAAEGGILYYAGHSMGGAVGVLTATSDDRLRGLVSLAGMVDCQKFAQTEFGEEESGFMWEEPDCPLTDVFLNDMEAVGNIVEKGSEVRIPWLLVHGTDDDVVLPNDSNDIFALANEPRLLHPIGGADHSFNDPAHRDEMVTTVVNWASAL
ncbi:MAG: alpha/beta hydrolase [Verrucomicrobiales bacterium]